MTSRKEFLWRLVTPSNVAVLLGLLCAIPFLRGLVTTYLFDSNGASQSFLGQVILLNSSAVVSLTQLVMGAKLQPLLPKASFFRSLCRADQSTDSTHRARFFQTESLKLNWAQLAAVTAVRLIVAPGLMVLTVFLCSLGGQSLLTTSGSIISHSDMTMPELVGLVLVLEVAAPVANNLVTIADLAGFGQGDISMLQLIQYLVGILTIPLWSSLQLYLSSPNSTLEGSSSSIK